MLLLSKMWLSLQILTISTLALIKGTIYGVILQIGQLINGAYYFSNCLFIDLKATVWTYELHSYFGEQ